MATNPYAMCPCGSGKKIKFCCGDLADEMEKVFRMVEGDQPTAALRHLDRLVKKNPRRTSLLNIKSQIELRYNKLDAARATIDEFLVNDPENPTAWARRAAFLCFAHQTDEAVDALQRAIAAYQEEHFSLDILIAIQGMAGRLLADRQPIAGAAHLELFLRHGRHVTADAFDSVAELSRTVRMGENLVGPWRLKSPLHGVAFQEQFQQADALFLRGNWRASAEVLDRLLDENPNDPTCVYNVALTHGILGDRVRLQQGLHQYAQLDVPIDDAVEAEAVAQLNSGLDDDTAYNGIDLIYEIDEPAEFITAIGTNRRVCLTQGLLQAWDLERDDEDDQSPQPVATFVVLETDEPDDWEKVGAQQVPRVQAFLRVFGKETDRPARAEVRLIDNDACQQRLATVCEILHLSLDTQPQRIVIGRITRLGKHFLELAYVPSNISTIVNRRLTAEIGAYVFTEIWPTVPQYSLGGKSPDEVAAASAKDRIAVEAAILVLEASASARRPHIAALRQRWDIPRYHQRLQPSQDDMDRLSIVALRRVATDDLSDEQLNEASDFMLAMNARRSAVSLVDAVLARPKIHESANVMWLVVQSINVCDTFAEVTERLNEARKAISVDIVEPPMWHIIELDAALEFAEAKRVRELFTDLISHVKVDGPIAEGFAQVMLKWGLVRPDGSVMLPAFAFEEAPQSAESEPTIWTPDTEAATPATKSAIWTPT